MPLSEEVVRRLKELVDPAYVNEASLLIKGRQRWKISRDTFETLSKIVAGLASIFAFAASAKTDPKTSDILAFTAGCLGTVSLVFTVFAGYSGKSSRARTRELNDILVKASISPMPNIAQGSPGSDGGGHSSGCSSPVHSGHFDIDVDELKKTLSQTVKDTMDKGRPPAKKPGSSNPSVHLGNKS